MQTNVMQSHVDRCSRYRPTIFWLGAKRPAPPPMPSPTPLADLRRLLADRFPPPTRRSGQHIPTGIPALDVALDGGLPAGALVELVSPGPSRGGQLVLASLLAHTRAARQRIALLDAADTFAPDEFPEDWLPHLVWARGGGALGPLWQAADFLLRDAHFSVVVIDLREVPLRALQNTPATTWWRLQRTAEKSSVAALLQTPAALAPCARHRFILEEPLTLAALADEQSMLAALLVPTRHLQRAAPPAAAA